MKNIIHFKRRILLIYFVSLLLESTPVSGCDHLGVPVPHGLEVAPQPGHEDGGEEGEGDQVEQGGLGRVHQEERDEGGHEAEDVSCKSQNEVESLKMKCLTDRLW